MPLPRAAIPYATESAVWLKVLDVLPEWGVNFDNGVTAAWIFERTPCPSEDQEWLIDRMQKHGLIDVLVGTAGLRYYRKVLNAVIPAPTDEFTGFAEGRVLRVVGGTVVYDPLSDFVGSGAFADHSARHENGGADEISVAGLSGLLADAQTPLAHGHAIADVTNLQSELDDKQPLNNRLSDLSILVPTLGLVEQVASAVFAIREIGTDAGALPPEIPHMGHFVDVVDIANAGLPVKMTASGDIPAHGHATLQPIDALLTAIAALVTANNKGLHFTGVDTVALHDQTALARTLLDDATESAMRATLLLGTAAVLNEGLGGADLVNATNMVNYIAAVLTSYQALAAKGAANGYCGLDANAIVAPVNLPAALTEGADTLTGTTDAGNTGYIPIRHFIRADATRTFTSNTSAQAIFTNPANGRITLETGLYRVEGVLYFTAMSGTIGNRNINLLGAGTATVAAWLWMAMGQDSAAGTVLATGGTTMITSTSGASIVVPTTATAMGVEILGTFEVTAAGTMIPTTSMVTAAASVLAIGSYLSFERMGATTAVSLGQWD